MISNMLNKKNVAIHLISLCALCLAFVVIRYLFFEIHGMKQWPELLFIVGVVVLTVSLVVKAKMVPVFTALAYIIGFAAGVFLQTDGVDPGGARTNNLWIIWTIVFIICIGLGVVGEVVTAKRKKQR